MTHSAAQFAVGALMDGNPNYYRRRAKEEREAALKSANASARQAHLGMAERYDALAGSPGHEIAEGVLASISR